MVLFWSKSEVVLDRNETSDILNIGPQIGSISDLQSDCFEPIQGPINHHLLDLRYSEKRPPSGLNIELILGQSWDPKDANPRSEYSEY